MLKTSAFMFVAATFSLGLVGATPADAAETARQGTARCGGNNFLRQGGTEVHKTFYNIKNRDLSQPIDIIRLVALDATGAILYDSAVSGLPPSGNGIIGPANSTLAPLQSTSIGSPDFLPFLDATKRPIQVVIVWRSVNPAYPVGVSTSRVVRERDPATGNDLAERSRSSGSCTSDLVP